MSENITPDDELHPDYVETPLWDGVDESEGEGEEPEVDGSPLDQSNEELDEGQNLPTELEEGE